MKQKLKYSEGKWISEVKVLVNGEPKIIHILLDSENHFFGKPIASVELKVGDNGEYLGFLNKEYKNCGNGYYYLLVNDQYFIGYDKD